MGKDELQKSWGGRERISACFQQVFNDVPEGPANSGTRLSRDFYQLASVMSAITVKLAFRSETGLPTH